MSDHLAYNTTHGQSSVLTTKKRGGGTINLYIYLGILLNFFPLTPENKGGEKKQNKKNKTKKNKQNKKKKTKQKKKNKKKNTQT